MHLPWKKSKSGRISRFVTDLQQSPKRGGSLVVETGFPTSLIDLFVKNRDRLKKSSSNKATTLTAPTRPRVLSPPLPTREIDESLVDGKSLTSENTHDGGDRGGGSCVLTVVVAKVFAVAVLALSTRKLAVGIITISAFSLLFLELAVARVFTQLIGKKKKREEEKVEESSPSSSMVQERKKNKVSFEIIESFQDSRDCIQEVQEPVAEKREVVLMKEKSKTAKLVKKLRSYKKKKKKLKQEAEGVEEVESETEVTTSLFSSDRIENEVSVCEEVECEEESGSKRDLSKVIVLLVISLAGLLSGKVIAIVLTLSWCLILRFVCCKSQTRL